MTRIVLLIILFLYARVSGAETLTVTIPANSTVPVVDATESAVNVQEPNATTIDNIRDDINIMLTNPRMDLFDKYLDELPKLSIQAGSDFSFALQWRTGDMPTPFPPGLWPRAELRSAKSPGGIVLATYTITVISEALVKWSLDLSAAQTSALSGQKGFTEMKIPYDVGVYHMYLRIPTEVQPRVTQ